MGRFSIGYQILVAVILGILTGLFFGPLTSALAPIGSVYTMLLQMVVLPYIAFSLIHGLGSMTPTVGKKIFASGWPYFLSLWLFVFFLIYLLATLIPDTLPPVIVSEGVSDVEGNFTKNFLKNLIPENPFYDVINNVVPAVAFFSIIIGIGMMHVSNKEPLIGTLERINQTLEKILYWLGRLSPIGAYVYISIAFGTIYFDDLFKMQLYVFAFIITALLVVFWVLPMLIAALTPMSFKEASKALRYVCLVPFVTGLSTAGIPFIANYLRKLSHKHETHEGFRTTSQTILPIAYSFGHIGNAMMLFFIFFLSYYYRHPFSLSEKGLLSILTVPLSLGSSTGNINAILFLIKLIGFPQGATNLFLEIKSFTNNFQVLMSIGSVFTLLLLTIYAYYGLIQVKWKELGIYLAAPIIAIMFFILSLQTFIRPNNIYDNLYMNFQLSNTTTQSVKATFLKEGEPGASREFIDPNVPEVLLQILQSKVLKVGYYPDSIPYCYFNNQNQLVGYDVAYAYELARDLECELQFVPFHFATLAENLRTGIFDVGMSSIIMDEKRLLEMQFTAPYFEDNNVLIVERAKKKPFININTAQKLAGLKIGAGGVQIETAQKNFPEATVINIEGTQKLLTGEIDAILWSKTSATIWCLSHPEYVVIDYGGLLGKTYFAYPFRQHALELGFFLNSWLTLKTQSGFKGSMENYWIYGLPLEERKPRWSILHNLLRRKR